MIAFKKSDRTSVLGGPGQLDAQDLLHLGDVDSRRHRLARLPGVDLGLGNGDHLGELLLVPALGIAGLRDGDSEVVWHGGRWVRSDLRMWSS